MRLRELQLGLRQVLRHQHALNAVNDPVLSEYLDAASTSSRATLVRQIIASWRAFDVGRVCPLTSLALRACGGWEEAIAASLGEPTPSRFLERIGEQFLGIAARNADPVVASIAQFERAYAAVRRGSHERFVVYWDSDPFLIIEELLGGSARRPSTPVPGITYRMTISGDIPNMISVDECRIEDENILINRSIAPSPSG